MLKTLFREVGRSLRRSEPAAVVSVDRYAELSAAFQAADVEARKRLLTELTTALDSSPEDAAGWTLQGDWLFKLGRFAGAEASYRQALQRQPMLGRAQEGLGLALLRMGQLEEAYLRLETASKIEPMNAEVLTHWGLVDLELGNLGRAAEKFQRAIERDPRNHHAWHNLGLVAYKQGNSAASAELIQRAIDIKPDHGLAYSNLSLALRRIEQLEPALLAAQRATSLKLDNARVWVVLADIQIDAADHDGAAASLTRAQAIDPEYVNTFVALGKLYAASGRYDEAHAAYRAGLLRDAENPDAQGGLAELKLLLAEWENAWDLHEARRRVEATPVRNFPYLEWQGEDVSGQRVLVHSEQGMGDIIMFSSCIPDLQARGARCVIEVHPRLQTLFARSFDQALVVGHTPNDLTLNWLNELPAIDRQIPIGTLPRWFRRRAEDFPNRTGYLKPDQIKMSHWQDRLSINERPSLGISWRGGLVATSKAQRSLLLHDLVRALHGCGAQLVCLQYGDVDEELRQVERDLGVTVHPGLSGYADFDDMAALTAACNGVVTVCSTQAHLTGALGKSGLVLVPRHPNWRYGATESTMPWYPNLTLARQDSTGQWHGPLLQANNWARELCRQHSPKKVPSE